VEDLSLRQVTERVAGFLLRENHRTGALVLELPGTRDELGAHVGTVREQMSRALSQLKREGVIDLDGRRVRITDLERLRQLSGARL
jgi:CRP-like cAMP-binding protein